jgi:hypothetical protein
MPGALGRFWDAWKRVARKIGGFQARVVLFAFYFLIFWPFALAVKWGSDPLKIKPSTPKRWQPRARQEGSAMERAVRQS